jgi:hypothetical protein
VWAANALKNAQRVADEWRTVVPNHVVIKEDTTGGSSATADGPW